MLPRMKRLLLGLLGALLLLGAILVVNALRLRPAPAAVQRETLALDADALASRLAAAIQIPTVSPTEAAPSLEAFIRLHALLQQQFPRVHAQLERETVNGGSLLYHWRGRADCAPLLLTAHQDVVPVEPGTEAGWSRPPFSGARHDGYLYGRGVLDDKGSLLAMLEAVERLLADGYVPACPVWLAFGHDEEVGGEQGAQALAARLQQHGVKPAFLLDEGGALTQGTFPGLAAPLATIGVAEKGYLNVRLSTRAEGGHSSMPPRATAIGRLAAALARLEARRPAAELGPVQRELLQRAAPQLRWPQRVVLSNLWLTAPLVEHLFAGSPASDATLRTTTAPTLFHAGVKENVLPQQADAVVNFRIRPGDDIAGVLAHVRATVDDAQVEVEAYGRFGSEPTAAAPWPQGGYAVLERVLRRVSPEADLVVAPYVTNGATDARHYAALTPNLYRFVPFKLRPDELAGLHGSNERLALEEYLRGVRFYHALLREFDAK
jgi:carboxypeptidase PM20D1